MQSRKLWLVVAFFLMGGAVSAENLKGRLGVGGIAQGGFPVGQKSVRDQVSDAGPLLGGLVQYGLSDHLSLGASYENLEVDGGLRVEPVVLQGIYRFLPENTWTPTLTLGAGASRGVDVKNFNHIAGKVGLGLDYFANPNFAIGPQITYHHVSDKDDSGRHLNSVAAGLAANYFFGGDSAPAPKVAEAPKPVPTPVQPPAPAVAAVPPVDTDGDGVIDSLDKCPGTPNGIPVDAEGCPRKMEEKVSIELKVLFDTGKAAVKPEYRGEIERVANFLKAYPTVNAEIEGHTDNVGDDGANQRLSQRRADAVRAFLMKEFSVEASRVTAVGYGEAKPIADNTTADGRNKNRRVVASLEAVKKS